MLNQPLSLNRIQYSENVKLDAKPSVGLFPIKRQNQNPKMLG